MKNKKSLKRSYTNTSVETFFEWLVTSSGQLNGLLWCLICSEVNIHYNVLGFNKDIQMDD